LNHKENLRYLISALVLNMVFLVLSQSAVAAGETIEDIVVRGNGRVESDAIITILKSKRGDPLSNEVVRDDMQTLFDLGYFSDLRFFKKPQGSGVVLVIQVAEKPAITAISYEGMTEVKEEDLKDKLETKLYTIVNEGKISADLRIIERQYAEKASYLSRVTYVLEKAGANEVHLKYVIDEGKMVQVAGVAVFGEKNFFHHLNPPP